MATSLAASAVTPSAMLVAAAFSAATLAAATAPRPAIDAAPPVNRLGIIVGIASPTDSTT